MSVKDAGMRVRVERELREAFVQACQAQGMVAAEVLREFMQGFAVKHAGTQAALFGGSADPAVAAPAAKTAKKAAR